MSEQRMFSNLINWDGMVEALDDAKAARVVLTYGPRTYPEVGDTPAQTLTWIRLDNGNWLLSDIKIGENE